MMIRARDQAGGAMLMWSRHAAIAAVSRPQAHQRRSHLSNSGSISCGKSWSQVKEQSCSRVIKTHGTLRSLRLRAALVRVTRGHASRVSPPSRVLTLSRHRAQLISANSTQLNSTQLSARSSQLSALSSQLSALSLASRRQLLSSGRGRGSCVPSQ
eukprot:3722987-Rhodomonas_salina.1